MILNLAIGAFILLFTLIGFFAGLAKGYTKVRKWAGEYIVSSLFAIGVGAIFVKLSVNVVIAGAITLIVAIVLILGCMGLSVLFQRIILRAMESREEIGDSYGAVGVINRIWGGIVVAMKGFFMATCIVVPVILILDFAQISALESVVADITGSAFWIAYRPIIFDLTVLGILQLSIRHGFASGFITSLWKLLVFVFIIGAAFLAYHLVFNVGTFDSFAAAIAEKLGSLTGNLSFLEGLEVTISKWLILVCLFLIFVIVISIISFFMKQVISFARLSSTFYVADGILGAIILVIIALVLMLFFGAILSVMAEYDFMQPFTAYFRWSTVARFIYTDNLLIRAGMASIFEKIVIIKVYVYETSSLLAI